MRIRDSRYFKSALGIGVGAVLLTTAVFANYESASGYNVCKDALKKAAFAENFSVDHTIGISIDGESYAKEYGSLKLNADGDPFYSSEQTTEEPNGDVYYAKNIDQGDTGIHMYRYNGDRNDGYITGSYRERGSLLVSGGGNPETGEKIVNFVETLGDTLIGDLKNSFVLSSEENGVSKYAVNLSKEQMPSYVTAAVSLLSSVIKNETNATDGYDDPVSKVVASGEPYVKDVGVTMSVDDDGNPVQLTGSVNFVGYNINGTEHTVSMDLSMDFYDFGATEIERVSDEELASIEDMRKRNDEIREKYGENAKVTSVETEEDGTTVWIDGDGPSTVNVETRE